MKEKDNLELRCVEELKGWYEAELAEAFPANERKPLSAIERLMEQGRYAVQGLYDGEALLGYATLWMEPGDRSYVLLDYLGVTAARRNGGLGGEILRRLVARYAGQSGILAEAECPVPGDDEEKNAIRRRRIGFYERCGFTPAYEMATCGMRFLTLVGGPLPADLKPVMTLHKAIYGPERVDVVVPLDPGREPPPSLFL